ncbi:hypothetical protein BH23BAC1_BH23BAC1_51150 [soil metagenome]
MKKIGRNELCHCGSGKKYKNCHQQMDSHKESRNKTLIIGGIIALFIILSALGFYFRPTQNHGTSAQGNSPEGKVWSSEHGHWHDE